jgi:hypothetical protein
MYPGADPFPSSYVYYHQPPVVQYITVPASHVMIMAVPIQQHIMAYATPSTMPAIQSSYLGNTSSLIPSFKYGGEPIFEGVGIDDQKCDPRTEIRPMESKEGNLHSESRADKILEEPNLIVAQLDRDHFLREISKKYVYQEEDSN